MLAPFPKTKELVELSLETLEEIALSNISEEEWCAKLEMCTEAEVEEDWVISFIGHIEIVNGMETTWEAGINRKFLSEGAKVSDVRKTLGTVVDPEWTIKLPIRDDHYTIAEEDLPASFDART
jgi:hypothetical protein